MKSGRLVLFPALLFVSAWAAQAQLNNGTPGRFLPGAGIPGIFVPEGTSPGFFPNRPGIPGTFYPGANIPGGYIPQQRFPSYVPGGSGTPGFLRGSGMPGFLRGSGMPGFLRGSGMPGFLPGRSGFPSQFGSGANAPGGLPSRGYIPGYLPGRNLPGFLPTRNSGGDDPSVTTNPSAGQSAIRWPELLPGAILPLDSQAIQNGSVFLGYGGNQQQGPTSLYLRVFDGNGSPDATAEVSTRVYPDSRFRDGTPVKPAARGDGSYAIPITDTVAREQWLAVMVQRPRQPDVMVTFPLHSY